MKNKVWISGVFGVSRPPHYFRKRRGPWSRGYGDENVDTRARIKNKCACARSLFDFLGAKLSKAR